MQSVCQKFSANLIESILRAVVVEGFHADGIEARLGVSFGEESYQLYFVR